MIETVTPAIELKDVSVSFGNTEVLKDVSVQLEKGAFLGIIGPNGGGKTTLIKVLLGLLSPDKGEVRIFGKKPEHAREYIGYVPQYSNFDFDFPISVWDVVLLGRVGKIGFKPRYSQKDKKLASRALKKVQMYEYKDRQISELSGGQMQRILVARALSTNPSILFLDEPTASMDEKIKTSIYELMEDLNGEGITIVLISHDIGVISTYVEKVACLNKYFIYHGNGELSSEMLEAAYECPVDLIAHGHPHRVFEHGMPQGEEEEG